MSIRKWVKESDWDYDAGKYRRVEDYGITVEYEIEADGGSYEWSYVAILSRVNDGKVEYAAYTDGGCSCNYPYDSHPDMYGFSWMPNADEAIRRIKAFMKDDSFFSDAQQAEHNVKLRQWKRVNA